MRRPFCLTSCGSDVEWIAALTTFAERLTAQSQSILKSESFLALSARREVRLAVLPSPSSLHRGIEPAQPGSYSRTQFRH